MIQFPCTSLFDAKIPVLEDHEEEILFFHPIWKGIKCNQLGVVYFDEEKYSSIGLFPNITYRTLKSPHTVLGTKEVVVYECYYGGDFKRKQFYHVNGNPYDFTPDNLIPTNDYKHPRREEAKENKKRFLEKTLHHLVRLEEKFNKEGISNQELHDFLMLPLWIRNARRIFRDGKIRYNKVKNNKLN